MQKHMKVNHKLLNEKCGIYRIINKVNNKIYIGSSKNLYDRLHQHFLQLRRNKHSNNHLQYSYNKYGLDNFYYEIIEFCDLEDQFTKEQYYITKFKPEYNKSLNVIPWRGCSPSKEQRKRISETLKLKYKQGIIDCYRQDHMWKKHFIYDIYTFELVEISKNRTECLKFLNLKGLSGNKYSIVGKQYIVSMIKFKKTFDLRNHIYKNYFKDRNDKYLIIKYNNNIHYFLSKTDVCAFMNKSKSFYFKYIKTEEYYKYKDYEIYYTKNYIKLPFKKEIS